MGKTLFSSCLFFFGIVTGIAHAQDQNSELAKADSLHELGRQTYFSRDLDGALILFQEAETIFVKHDRHDRAINSVLNISQIVEGKAGSLDSVMKILERAKNYSNKLPEDAFGTALYYQRLGELAIRDGRYEDALYYTKRSLQIIKKHPEHPTAILEERGSYDRLATSELRLFNYAQMEIYAKKSMAHSKANNIDYNFAAAVLFDAYSLMGRTVQADSLLAAIDSERLLENAQLFVTYDHYRDRIRYFISQERYDEALNLVKVLNTKIENSPYKYHFLDWYYSQTVSSIYLAKKEYKKVIEIIEGIDVAIQNTQRRPVTRAMDFKKLAYCRYQLNNLPQAEIELQTAINLHLPKELQSSDFFAEVDYTLAYEKNHLIDILNLKSEIAVHQFEKTLDSRYEAVAVYTYNQQHELIKLLGERSREDHFVKAIGYQKMYEDYFDLLHKRWQKNPSEALFYKALTIADQSKNSAILSELKERKIENTFRSIPIELLERERGLKQSLDTISLTLDSQLRQRRMDSLKGAFDTLKTTLRRDFPNYYRLSFGSDMPLKDIVESNFSTVSLTEYLVGKEAIFILNKNGTKLQFDKVLLSRDLKNGLQTYLASVRKPSDNSYRDVEEMVFNELFKKYMDSSKSNIVVLDDDLHLIPLSALVLNSVAESSNTQFSICRINTLTQFSESNSTLLDKALVMAPFAGGPNSSRRMLSGSLEEAEYVQNLMGGVIKLNEEATKEAFITEAADYAILHIATHSEVNLKHPLKSTIYFSESASDLPSESQLRIEELYAMSLNSEMVTLSACETGLGQEIKGRGVQSISNAFSYAGVASTVMSLWKVPDVQTKEIMLYFYDNLKEGLPKDLALQKAKENYLNATQDKALKHPYYWAGFVISGDPSPIESSAPFNWYVAMGALLLGLVGFRLLFRLKKEKLAS